MINSIIHILEMICMAIGIIGAMKEEVAGLIEKLSHSCQTTVAGLTFYQGKLVNHPIVVVQSGIGKVNAAMCTQILIDHFSVSAIINTGVAGGVKPAAAIGDVAIATHAMHHDFDVTVFGYDHGTVPGLETSCFAADSLLQQIATASAHKVLGAKCTHSGIIVSGDQFIASTERKQYLDQKFNALCAEMEGAAIAHVAYLNQIPYCIIRIISDQADASAPDDFNSFIAKIIPDLNQIVIEIVRAYSDCSNR